IDGRNLVPIGDQTVAQMRTNESGSAGDDVTHPASSLYIFTIKCCDRTRFPYRPRVKVSKGAPLLFSRNIAVFSPVGGLRLRIRVALWTRRPQDSRSETGCR